MVRIQTLARTTNLFLLDDLADDGRAGTLAGSDLSALRAVADWIETFVARPHAQLGRAGPVCPFVPEACARRMLWLAPERIVDRRLPDVVELINAYRRLLLDVHPVDGEDADFKSILVVFTDVATDRATALFDDLLQQLGVSSYVEDGLVLGAFHEGNKGSAIYNHGFRPFTAPVPFLLVRPAVVSDWKFFLNDDGWLGRWAHRYRESGVEALAQELRRLSWPVARK